MEEAIKLSREAIAADHGGPFGAVVVKEGRIIGRGRNAVISKNDPTAHAEIVAIRDACASLGTFALDNCELYTSCEPCPMCLAAIYWARISKVFYANNHEDAKAAGFDDAFLYDEICLPLERRKVSMVRLMSNEAKAVLEEWNELSDKTEY